ARRCGECLGGGRRRMAFPRADPALDRPDRPFVLHPVRPEARDRNRQGGDLVVGRLHRLLLDVVAARKIGRRAMKRAVAVCLVALLMAVLPAASRQEKAEASEKTIINSIGMKLVLIPAGTFQMGSPATEDQRDDIELRHEVTIGKPFYVGA